MSETRERAAPPRRGRRRVWIALALGVAAVVVAALALPWLVDLERHRGRLEQALERATGWSAELGELSLSLRGGLRVTVSPARLVAPDGAGTIAVERVDVRAELRPLLRGDLRLRELTFVRPSIVLVKTDAGRGYVLPLPAARPAAPAGGDAEGGFTVAIDRVAVRDGALRLEDRTVEPATALAFVDLDLELAPATGAIDGTARLADDPGRIRFAGSYEETLRVGLESVRAEALRPWVGETVLGPGGTIDGEVTVALPAVVARLSGHGLRLLGGLEPIEALELDADLRAAGEAWDAERLVLRAGGAEITGSGRILPEMAVDLELPSTPLAPALALARALFPIPLELHEPGAVSMKARIEAGPTGELGVSARGELTAARYVPGGVLPAVEGLRTSFALSPAGTLELDPLRGQVGGGPLEGTARIDRLDPPGLLEFRGRIDGAALGVLLGGFLGSSAQEIRGPATLEAQVAVDLGQPTLDARAIRAGRLGLSARRVEIPGWDLEGEIRGALRKKLGPLADAAGLPADGAGDPAAGARGLLDRLDCALRLDELPWALEELKLDAGGLSARGKGRFDPVAGEVALDLVARLDAERTQALVGRASQLQALVDSKGRLALGLEIKGPATRPKIKVDLDRALERGRDRAVEGLLRDLLD